VAEINKLFGNPAASEQLLVEFETIHNAIRLNANRQAADAVLKLIAAVKLHNEP
jgi:competence protein ComGF